MLEMGEGRLFSRLVGLHYIRFKYVMTKKMKPVTVNICVSVVPSHLYQIDNKLTTIIDFEIDLNLKKNR